MRHLTPEVLIDLAEDTAGAEWPAHLSACAECRDQLESLRSMLADVRADAGAVPEPSPLFWDHLSKRVRDAVADEPLGGRSRWVPLAGWRAIATAIAAAAALVLVLAWPRDAAVPMTPVSPVPSTAETFGDEAAVLSQDADESLAWLADLAADVEWDEASEPPIEASVSDWAAAALTDAERAELHRLLQDALAGNGV
jgi:anti-sigma-K factor RskA